MKDKSGNEIVITEDNAHQVAELERKFEAEGKDPIEQVVDLENLSQEKQDEDREIDITKDKYDDEDKQKKEELGEEEFQQHLQSKYKKKEIKDDEPKEKTSEELLAAKVDDLTEEEKTKRQELIEAEEAEEKRLLEAKDEDLSEDDKKKKATVLLKVESRNKESFDNEVKEYAKTKEIGTGEARKVLENINKVISKYDNDPKKIAEANLGLQRLISQKDEEVLAIRQEASQPRKPQTAREWEAVIREHGLITTNGKKLTWQEVVETYRNENPDSTDELEDERVLKMVSSEIAAKSETFYEKKKSEDKKNADEKREKLLDSLGDDNKQFKDEVKKLLKTIPDNIVLRKDYDISHSISWARGKYYTPDKVAEIEREAEEKGFKRGQASVKVISGPIKSGGKPKGTTYTSLTPKQKDEAWEMFPGAKDDKECFELYTDVLKSREGNKKKE